MAKNSNVDLSKLSLVELQGLAQDIEGEITSRRVVEKERVLNQMRELAGSLGLTLEELVRQERIAGGPAVVVAKYRHPDNPSLTWSGRGKRPTWVNEALASGRTLEDLAVS